MKKRIVLFVLGLLAFGSWCRFCRAATTFQPQNLGYVTVSISSMSATLIQNTTPQAVGTLVYCTNCASAGGKGTICVSTTSANALNAFVLSTGTTCN